MMDLYRVTDLSGLYGPLDRKWSALAKKEPSISRLCEIMISLLTVPHSSAACERVFSMVRKNLTDQEQLGPGEPGGHPGAEVTGPAI